MLTDLHENWSVLATKPPAEDHELAALRSVFPRLPSEYDDLVRVATEVELKGPGKQYLRIWGPEGCIGMDRGYGISRWIPGAIPIGDNGGCKALVYHEGGSGCGLYLVSYSTLDADYTSFVAPSLHALLREGVGMEVLW